MTEGFDEGNFLRDHKTKGDFSVGTTQTLFSPKITLSLDDDELEEPGVDENKAFSNKNILEIPAVLLSTCSRRRSKSDQNLRSGSPSEFLVPPLQLKTPTASSNFILLSDEKTKAQAFPVRKLSLPTTSWSTDFIFNPNQLNGCSGDHGHLSLEGNETFDDQSIEGDTRSKAENNKLSFASQGSFEGSSRGSTVSLKVSDRLTVDIDNTTTSERPVNASALNLHPNTSSSCRRPSRQLCCLLGRGYTALSSPSSECSSSRFSHHLEVNDYGYEKDEDILSNEFHCCSENTDESDLPLLSTSAVTESSILGVSEQTCFISPKHEPANEQLATPDLRLKKAHTLFSDWKTGQLPENLQVNLSNPTLRKKVLSKTASSTVFLHPDSAARVSSSSGWSAVSWPHSLSSKTLLTNKKKTRLDLKRPRLRHQPFSFHSLGSSAHDGSSDKTERSTVKSLLSLISPSKLLSKFSSSKQSVQSSEAKFHRKKRQYDDFPDDDKVVTLNVSGRRFKIQDYFLSIYPDTLLGGKARSLFYDKVRDEFFFDRDPDCFRYIWNFYLSGQLHCPREECLQFFLDEVAFFGLDISMICNCCWQETFEATYEKLAKRREEKEAAEKEVAEETHILEPDASLREKVWITLQEPSSSFIAKMFYIMSIFVIAVSVVANTTETIKCEGALRICQEENEETYFYIDTVCVGFFTFEYVARIIVCPNRLRFIINYMSVVDVLAILPYYIDLLLEYLSVGTSLGMDALVVLRVLRTLRVFKLLRHSKRLKKLTQSVRNSATELGLISFVYLVLVILFSSIIYFAELSDDTQFSSIPEAMWYAVITSTTAG